MSTLKVTDANSAALLAALSSSFDHAPWAVTEVSGEEHIVRYANSAFCGMIDKARDEVIGRPLDMLLPPADECLALVDRVFRTGTAASYTADEQAAPFPLLFSYNLWPVRADGRTAGDMIQVNETGALTVSSGKRRANAPPTRFHVRSSCRRVAAARMSSRSCALRSLPVIWAGS